MESFVNVSVRIRPPADESSCLQVINDHPPILMVLDKSQTYHFDNIFTPDVNQEEVYNDTVKSLTDHVKAGYNCTVFAYGQTGTGKTYTIGTNPDVTNEQEAGLISRTLEDLFSFTDEYIETAISISFIEIYNEKVFDLLLPQNTVPLSVKGFTVQGCKKLKVDSPLEALEELKFGSKRRHTGGTKQNVNSSRSHAIFSIYYQSRSSTNEIKAKLNLVDLAGSERVNKTGNQGCSFYEGININKGLLSLGQVMTALSTNSSHIPYRQSLITTILQDSLNKKNYVTLIACVSSSPEDLAETLQTLEFSNRVKKMKNKPEVNQFLTQYKKDNPSLFPSCPRGLTPSKRNNGNSYETPFKKTKTVLSVVQETPFSINNSAFEITPLMSSSMMSMNSCTHQNFSPVIRKHIKEMECSIVNKLEDMIKNSLRRSRRLSARKENKENDSLRVSWSGIAKVLYSKMTPDRATSSPKSPLEKHSITEEISPEDNREKSPSKKGDESIFLVPDVPKTKKPKLPKRSSVRLQLKKISPEISMTLPKSTTRRSVRLQLKQPKNNENVEKTTKKRKSKEGCSCVCSKEIKVAKKVDSPITSRTNQVLDILNNGTIRELEKLHTVGAKTAEKIYLFRQMKGSFRSISDIAEMPYWSKKKYEKFLAENFVRS